MSEERRFLTDDRDIDEDRHELVVFMGGNGDWYISILPLGQKIGPTVRISTSGGAAATHPRLPAAVADLWRALAWTREDDREEHDYVDQMLAARAERDELRVQLTVEQRRSSDMHRRAQRLEGIEQHEVKLRAGYEKNLKNMVDLVRGNAARKIVLWKQRYRDAVQQLIGGGVADHCEGYPNCKEGRLNVLIDRVLVELARLREQSSRTQQLIEVNDTITRFNDVLQDALQLNAPYPITSVLKHLVDAAAHMFEHHDCDTDGWEVWQSARDHGRELLERISKSDVGGELQRELTRLREQSSRTQQLIEVNDTITRFNDALQRKNDEINKERDALAAVLRDVRERLLSRALGDSPEMTVAGVVARIEEALETKPTETSKRKCPRCRKEVDKLFNTLGGETCASCLAADINNPPPRSCR